MEVAATSLHDAGEYTFVLEGYSQSLAAKVHIIGERGISVHGPSRYFFNMLDEEG